LYSDSQNLILQLSLLVEFVGNIHIARHVDIDGIRREPGDAPGSDLYTQTVENARLLIRTLEAAMQSLYDDGSSFLMAAQTIHRQESVKQMQRKTTFFGQLDGFAAAIKANLGVILQSFEALLSIGHDQADMAQGDYNGSIEWRMSRLSIIDTPFGGAHHPLSTFSSYGEDIVDMELAFQKPGMKAQTSADSSNMYHSSSLIAETTASILAPLHIGDMSNRTGASGSMNTLVPLSTISHTDSTDTPSFEDDRECSSIKLHAANS
jgi:son of sevenless-like protein